MSYDLLVFDPDLAPREREAFLDWYENQTEWSEPHSYNDPAVATPALRAWFFDMIKEFPQMNGPYATEGDDLNISDYSIGQSVIYVGFAWSVAEAAREAVFRLATKHRVGFFDVSSETGAVWVPDAANGLKQAHSG